ncbi:MAG TPA: GtrA family protein [Candidatus Saccharimonadales bacterium]|nr:GtrA family protein [Candidatus Saccharimonadales bacterium]
MRLPSKAQVVQFLEYWLGGNVFFISGYLTFSLLFSVFHWRWWQAKLVADVVGWTLNYLVQRYWAFNNQDLSKHEGRARLRYIIISIVDTVLDYLIIGGLVALGVTPYLGMFVAAGFFTVWNYAWYRWWVFK